MKKTIVCNFIGKKGGGPLYAYEMAKGIIENDYNVVAIIPDNIENSAMWQSLEGCKIITVKGYKDSYISLLSAMARVVLFERRKIKKACKGLDIVGVYVPMIQPLTTMINKCFSKKQRVVTLHDPIPHKGAGKLSAIICERAVKKSEDVVVLSEKFREYTSNHYKVDINRVHVIPHGIFDKYKNVYDKACRYEYDGSKVNFLFFGRITPYKGLEVLAGAYKKLSQEFSNVALTIVGNGDFSPYKQLYEGLSNVALVNRWIKDQEVYGFFDSKDVITVLPYIEATQSGVIPVAMACESFVICSNCGGLAEQVEDGVTGKLVEPSDQEQLYGAMKQVVLNGVDNKIVATAKEQIEKLSWDKLANKLVKIFN